MGEILGIGLSHFGGFMFDDREMAARVRQRLEEGRLPDHLKTPEGWPAPMREEWGQDQGATFASRHRRDYFEALDGVREALDSFAPDAVILFGDDQYECFREDLVPPYCIFAGERFLLRPYQRARGIGERSPNIWGDPFDAEITVRGAPEIARLLLTALPENGFDPAYSYTLPHQDSLGHAFANTLLMLDHRRQGLGFPILPFAINAYGSALIRMRGGLSASPGTEAPPDPPAPSPRRCFDLGRAIARILRPSPWRVALMASASFSHAFLTAKTSYFYPDTETDRLRFAELARGDYEAWARLGLADLEEAGEHELLNWCPMIGAMAELGQTTGSCVFLESYLMNSNKCVAIIPPAAF